MDEPFAHAGLGQTPTRAISRCWWVLHGLGLASAAIYLVVCWLNTAFAYGSKVEDRPILAVLLLFTLAFVVHLVALRVALRGPFRGLAPTIIGWALVFRAVGLMSEPIQEIDIYRYLWDGIAAKEGVSPYRFSPGTVLQAGSTEFSQPELAQLAALRERSPAATEILNRVHYAELPTVYPPVSQAVFWLAALITPDSASVAVRMLTMKGLLVAFDIGTMILVVKILSMAGKHRGWLIVYAWCPLVIKEIANSGHLDSIAVFWTTGAVYVAARSLLRRQSCAGVRWLATLTAAALLSLGIGAKLYPVVLIPLLTAAISRCEGWRLAAVFAVVTFSASAALLAPMLPGAVESAPPPTRSEIAPDPMPPNEQPSTDSLAGLRAFLGRWEMNDFLFLITIENLRPHEVSTGRADAWFAVVPNSWRRFLVDGLSTSLSINRELLPFLLARCITGLVFAMIALSLARRVRRSPDTATFLEATFLTLAWFWLLAPTQNPWYWTWALPLLPFARGRAWLAVSGLVMTYYLRFWLVYHAADEHVFGTRYQGAAFFDFVVTWLEFAPLLLWLAVEWISGRRPVQLTGSTSNAGSNVSCFTEEPSLRR